jgi:hypothetical protein
MVEDLPLAIKFTADLQAVTRLRMSGAIIYSPPHAFKCAQGHILFLFIDNVQIMKH